MPANPQIPDIQQMLDACVFEAVKSSGKGGQNVNKVATKVILLFDVNAASFLEDQQIAVLLDKLHTRISKDGILRISSGRERSQEGNRKMVMQKFLELIEKAFTFDAERIGTRPTAGSRARRLADKKLNALKKSSRRITPDDDHEANP